MQLALPCWLRSFASLASHAVQGSVEDQYAQQKAEEAEDEANKKAQVCGVEWKHVAVLLAGQTSTLRPARGSSHQRFLVVHKPASLLRLHHSSLASMQAEALTKKQRIALQVRVACRGCVMGARCPGGLLALDELAGWPATAARLQQQPHMHMQQHPPLAGRENWRQRACKRDCFLARAALRCAPLC